MTLFSLLGIHMVCKGLGFKLCHVSKYVKFGIFRVLELEMGNLNKDDQNSNFQNSELVYVGYRTKSFQMDIL